MERGGEFAQVGRDEMRLEARARGFDDFAVARQFAHDDLLGFAVEAIEFREAVVAVPLQSALAELAHHAGDARMRVLHVVDRVVVGLRAGEVDVEDELRIGFARDQEPARRVAADFVDEVAQLRSQPHSPRQKAMHYGIMFGIGSVGRLEERMAMFRLEAKIFSREKRARSVVAAAAYRAGTKLRDEIKEKIFDYARKITDDEKQYKKDQEAYKEKMKAKSAEERLKNTPQTKESPEKK